MRNVRIQSSYLHPKTHTQYPLIRSHDVLTDEGSGKIECNVEYSCCLCGSITCGSTIKPCDSFKAGAAFGAFGVQQIQIFGEIGKKGAVIDCDGIFMNVHILALFNKYTHNPKTQYSSKCMS